VNAALGFLNFLSRLLPDRRPSKLVVALDADWRPQFRVDAMPSYKSHRVAGPDDPPDPVDPQMKIIIELLDAFGISMGAAVGYEAEDVIATIAERTSGPIEIVTGDRDLFALVKDPNVRVLYTLRGVTELGQVDEAYIRNKYGIPGDRREDREPPRREVRVARRDPRCARRLGDDPREAPCRRGLSRRRAQGRADGA